MSNHITIELCQEDRERLDLLSSVIIALGDKLVGQSPAPALAVHTPEPEAPEPAPAEPVADPEQPKYTKDDVLAKVQKLAEPNNPKREQAKAIVKSYGAKVSDIPADKYDEVMAKLTDLEVEA